MTTWLERREKIQQHTTFVEWRQKQDLPASVPPQRQIYGPPQPDTRCLMMARNLTIRRVSFNDVIHNYGAVDFMDTLGDFLVHVSEPHASGRTLRNLGANTLIPFQHVPVFHKIKFTDGDGTIIDSVHIRLEQVDAHGWIISARFDTVLIRTGQQPNNTQGGFWLDRYRVKIHLTSVPPRP